MRDASALLRAYCALPRGINRHEKIIRTELNKKVETPYTFIARDIRAAPEEIIVSMQQATYRLRCISAAIRPGLGRASGSVSAARLGHCHPWHATRPRTRRFLLKGSRPGWSGSRTRDTRMNRPMLYPTELSNGATCRIRTGGQRHHLPLLFH